MIDYQSGISLMLLSLITIFLMMKLFEKKLIFKSILISILLGSFFIFITKIKPVDSITFYSTSLELGLIFLLIISIFISWDEEGEEYI